tara:strand:+ start:1012 stop:2706 length:1695 start_codon:yes stop_codon:yes gene_type:complete
MKSVSGMTWKIVSIPERLIIKKKQDFNTSYLLSKILLEKKYSNEEIYNSLNNDQLNNLTYFNEDFVNAGNIFQECIKNNKKILIFGDYDVDGYSSTYLLYDFITKLNVKCDFYIPDRFKDGYGPNKNLLNKLIDKNKYSLVFFVDCASNSSEEIKYLEKNGLKIIIIDHHQIYNKNNYKNTVIINPLKNYSENQFSFFCSTTLVYFFINYLCRNIKKKIKVDFNKYLFFSAVATICDQMPLRKINKKIVKNGLKNYNFSNFPNFKRILKLKKKISSTDIGFNLGPMLNSPSRLGYSDLPIKLLIETNNNNINKFSDKLINLNEKRKNIQNETFKLLNNNTEIIKNEVIFKYESNINEGLLGIIASNFVELYEKPSFVLTKSNDYIKCSARSIYGFDIGKIFYEALNRKIILKGGGHSMAGGCLVKNNKIFDFKNFLNNRFNKIFIKLETQKYYISEQSLESLRIFAKSELQKLEPFGNNNFNPFFLIKKNKIIKFKILKNLHLQLLIKNNLSKSCLCFVFNAVGTELGDMLMSYKKDIDFIVQINNKIIQKNSDFNLIIKDAIA